ncbi:chemotaxis protein CheC [Priestia taiwanensis]|uniref:CheY-P phosphatase CheC n=1 Tax=Priestia taiwanensis TaxID=1347902 RepID=A0A917EP39_9BACI|nr:chemotaxis protein CheC [Priestia taiwanensis]MBM7362819.1 chemotaxis protein CheC [Priestia taiwanensis]GGE65367.1 CheY-P phosphatase CheC [Priestia taiwanensis]
MDNNISPVHLDVLKEIGNIGAGNAATSLSQLLQKKIDMKVPSVRILSFNEMIESVGEAESVVVSVFLRLEGDITGNMYVLLTLEQATHFIKHLTSDNEFSFEQLNGSELSISALQELSNILAGSYLRALSDFSQLRLYPSVPELSIDMLGASLSHSLIELSQESDVVIMIDTTINEDVTGDSYNSHFLLMPDPESLRSIFRALGVE